MSTNMIFTKYMDEMKAYLSSKLPELPEHTAQEIAAHIANKTYILANDILIDHERERRYRDRAYEMRMRNVQRETFSKNEG